MNSREALTQAQFDAHELHAYQLESRQSLSSVALNNVRLSMQPILAEAQRTIVMPHSDMDEIFNIVMQLDWALKLPERHHQTEQINPDELELQLMKINCMQQRLQQFVDDRPAFSIAYPSIGKHLKSILSALNDYNQYNRNNAMLASLRFAIDLKSSLTPYFIHTDYCYVVEETMLHMAGVNTKPEKCQFQPSYLDLTRYSFRIEGISEDDGKKLIEWLQKKVDDTVALDAEKPYVCEFDIDGEMLLTKFLPLFKDEIESSSILTPEKLLAYVEKSSHYFKKNIIASVNEQLTSLIDLCKADSLTKGEHAALGAKLTASASDIIQALKSENEAASISATAALRSAWAEAMPLDIVKEYQQNMKELIDLMHFINGTEQAKEISLQNSSSDSATETESDLLKSAANTRAKTDSSDTPVIARSHGGTLLFGDLKREKANKLFKLGAYEVKTIDDERQRTSKTGMGNN